MADLFADIGRSLSQRCQAEVQAHALNVMNMAECFFIISAFECVPERLPILILMEAEQILLNSLLFHQSSHGSVIVTLNLLIKLRNRHFDTPLFIADGLLKLCILLLQLRHLVIYSLLQLIPVSISLYRILNSGLDQHFTERLMNEI